MRCSIVNDASRPISQWHQNLEPLSRVINYNPKSTIYTHLWCYNTGITYEDHQLTIVMCLYYRIHDYPHLPGMSLLFCLGFLPRMSCSQSLTKQSSVKCSSQILAQELQLLLDSSELENPNAWSHLSHTLLNLGSVGWGTWSYFYKVWSLKIVLN